MSYRSRHVGNYEKRLVFLFYFMNNIECLLKFATVRGSKILHCIEKILLAAMALNMSHSVCLQCLTSWWSGSPRN